jgi:hypothetical protein
MMSSLTSFLPRLTAVCGAWASWASRSAPGSKLAAAGSVSACTASGASLAASCWR